MSEQTNGDVATALIIVAHWRESFPQLVQPESWLSHIIALADAYIALTPSDGTSSTGTAGTPTPASAPVVVLDEYRVLTRTGFLVGPRHDTENRALVCALQEDEVYPKNAPHRVMRVCLQEVSDA